MHVSAKIKAIHQLKAFKITINGKGNARGKGNDGNFLMKITH